MSTYLVRMRNAALAVKAESTAGTDSIAGSPSSGDWIQGDVTISLNPMIAPVPGFTGSLDSEVDVVGGFKPTLQITVPFRGSGTAGTPPGPVPASTRSRLWSHLRYEIGTSRSTASSAANR